jgi:hypothetical protein
MGDAAMAEHILIRREAKARHLAYLIEQLNTCPMEEPTGDGAQVDEMERAYWGQAIAALRRGLDERQIKVRH